MLIDSEDVKQAITERLLGLFPGSYVYKEAKTTPLFPHFFVYQINLLDTEERKDFHILSYSMEIRYRVASDSSTDLKLEQNLDNMALKLLQGFTIINFEDEKIRCVNKRIEKVDGVLHFTFNVEILVKYINDEEKIPMKILDVKFEMEE